MPALPHETGWRDAEVNRESTSAASERVSTEVAGARRDRGNQPTVTNKQTGQNRKNVDRSRQ